MDGASWALTHIQDVIDIKGVLFYLGTTLFVVPGGYYEAVLRN